MGLVKERLIQTLFGAAAVWACYVALDLRRDAGRWQQPNMGATQAGDVPRLIGYTLVMLAGQLAFRPMFSAVARAMIPKKTRWSNAVWGAKVIRCCDAVFKCSYYAAMSTWGFLLLRGEPWVPWVLGGRGETRFCWPTDGNFEPASEGLRQFYVIAVSYHLSEILMLLLDSRHPDFWEMLLHHTVACSLTIYSYVLNYIRIGSLVLLLHGATDIWIYASKALVDTPNTHMLVISYLALIMSYAWFRIYVFPVYIMRSAWVESVQHAGGKSLYGWGFLNFALCVLLLLHMYWFGLIIKIGFLFKRTGQARDIQSNLSAIDMMDANNKKQT